MNMNKYSSLQILFNKIYQKRKKRSLIHSSCSSITIDQFTLVSGRHVCALLRLFSPTCSIDCVVSFNDDSELKINIEIEVIRVLSTTKKTTVELEELRYFCIILSI